MLGVGQPLFALGAVSDALIRIFDSRGDKGTPLTTVNVHSAPVTMLRMHPQLNAVHTHNMLKPYMYIEITCFALCICI